MLRDDVFITNCYKLRPPGNRTPTDEELKEHELMLAAELSSVRPEYILTLGATALKVMTGLTGVRRKRGEWIEYVSDYNATDVFMILPTWHPSYILQYGASERSNFFDDVAKFFRTDD